MKVVLDNLHKIENNTNLKGIASVIIDDAFKVTGIKIINGKNGLFLQMPYSKLKDGSTRDIAYPINSETRKMFNDIILTEYNKED